MPKPTVKIIDPDWPSDYVVIAQAKFDPTIHQLWPPDRQPEPRPPSLEAEPIEAEFDRTPPEPLPPPPAVAQLEPEPPAAVPPPAPAAPQPQETAPPALTGIAARWAKMKIADLGPILHDSVDGEALGELARGDSRATVRRLAADRLKALDKPKSI